MAVYVVAVSLSLPGASLLTISGGILFGTLVGAGASCLAATTGATIIFLVAKSACGETFDPPRRAARRQACRRVPLGRVQLPVVPAPGAGVPVLPGQSRAGAGRRAIGHLPGRDRDRHHPATFAFTFLGSGLDSVIAAQEKAYRACLAAGRTECPIQFDLGMIVTPQLLAALVTLGVIALLPVVVKRLRARSARPAPLS
jgi:uncharacterized membrane protein YdjX (TVP38/TMEM64 family)